MFRLVFPAKLLSFFVLFSPLLVILIFFCCCGAFGCSFSFFPLRIVFFWIIRGCNPASSEFQKYYTIPVMNVDTSKNKDSSQLDRSFIPIGLRKMLNGKDLWYLHVVFPLVFGYADTLLGLQYVTTFDSFSCTLLLNGQPITILKLFQLLVK